MKGAPSVLSLEDVHLTFGGVRALAGVSFEVAPAEIFAIIGPNGAGKTSVFNVISGLYPPGRGRVLFEGRDVARVPPHGRAALGIARTFQNLALFKGMTVLDNIKLGAHARLRAGVISGGLYLGPARREELACRERIEREIIDLLEIESIRKRIVGTLPYGLQKRVELARALAVEPKILLLDEPMAGLNAEETEDMARFILDVNEQRRVTSILIEHDMGVVMDISSRVMVLDFGRRIALGTPDEVRHDRAVVRAYLGEESGMEAVPARP